MTWNTKLFEAVMVVQDVIEVGDFCCVTRKPEQGPRTLRYLEANGTWAIVEALAKHWGVTLDA